MGALGRIERRYTGSDEAGRYQGAAVEAAVATERHPEDATERQRPPEREDLVAGEVSERVGDQTAPIPLHPPQHVGAVADDDVRARVDDRMGERDDVASILAEVHLGSRPHVRVIRALRTGVHGDDDDVCLRRGRLHETPGGRDILELLRPRVWRKADHRHPDLADLLVGDLARTPRVRETLSRERGKRLRLPGRAVVERVVVREVHHREAGLAQPRRVRRRRLEGVTVGAAGTALRTASRGESPLEVPEHDIAGEIGLDTVEERPAAGGRQVRCRAHHDVADGGDRDDPCGHGARRLRHDDGLLDGDDLRCRLCRLGYRCRCAVDEQREEEPGRHNDGTRSQDECDEPHGKLLVAVAEKDERVVGEL